MTDILDALQVQRPNAERARMAQTLLWVSFGFAAATALITGIAIILPGVSYMDVVTGGLPMWVMQSVLVAIFAVHFITVGYFIAWLRRGYANLHRLGYPGLSRGESAAVWTWFVPIANLFMPYRIGKETYSVFRYLAHKVTGRTDYTKPGQLAGRWWGWFVATGLAGYFLNVASGITNSITDFTTLQMWIVAQQLIVVSVRLIATVYAVRFISESQAVMDEVFHGEELAKAAIAELEPA